MTLFSISLPAIWHATTIWDDQAEDLRGGRKRLTDAVGAAGSLGDRVGPVAETYLRTWVREVTRQASQAEGRANGLRQFTGVVVDLDEEAAADLRNALPWSEGVTVRAIVGPTR